jgi:hypothetical protein
MGRECALKPFASLPTTTATCLEKLRQEYLTARDSKNIEDQMAAPRLLNTWVTHFRAVLRFASTREAVHQLLALPCPNRGMKKSMEEKLAELDPKTTKVRPTLAHRARVAPRALPA